MDPIDKDPENSLSEKTEKFGIAQLVYTFFCATALFTLRHKNELIKRVRRDASAILNNDDNVNFPTENIDMFDEEYDEFDTISSETLLRMQYDLGIPDEQMYHLPANLTGPIVLKAASLNRFRANQVSQLHDKMIEAYRYRKEILLPTFLGDANIKLAEQKPIELLEDKEKRITKDFDHQNNKYHSYDGPSITHPIIEKLLDGFGYDPSGENLFRHGKTQLWMLFPAAVPLFTGKFGHLGQYKNYWNFLMNFKKALPFNNVRISVGIWAKGAVFSPRGAINKPQFPWHKIQRYYNKPRMTTKQPSLIATVNSLLPWISKFGASSPSVGTDCYIMWFHQDFGADSANLLIPDQFQRVQELNSACNILHTFVGVKPYDEDVKRYASQLIPGLRTNVPRDWDFSGVFFAEHFAYLDSDEYLQTIFKYLTVLQNRGACRTNSPGWVPEPTEPSLTLLAPTEGPTGDPDFNDRLATEAPTSPVELVYGPSTGGLTASAPTGAPTMRGILDEANILEDNKKKIPEIDSCCGHDMYLGLPYDSELKTCCEDGNLRAWNEDGTDPCRSLRLSSYSKVYY